MAVQVPEKSSNNAAVALMRRGHRGVGRRRGRFVPSGSVEHPGASGAEGRPVDAGGRRRFVLPDPQPTSDRGPIKREIRKPRGDDKEAPAGKVEFEVIASAGNDDPQDSGSALGGVSTPAEGGDAGGGPGGPTKPPGRGGDSEESSPDDPGDRPYRLRSEIEKTHRDIEALQPTPITEQARETLASWGVPEVFIERLQDLASSCRFDLAQEKAEQIAQRGGLVYEFLGEKKPRAKVVVLPDFESIDGRLDGTTDDLSRQFIILLHQTGYLEEVNRVLQENGKRRLLPVLTLGETPSFLNATNETQSLWTGLVPDGASIHEMVTVDVAFQQISNGENGYIMERCDVNPDSVRKKTSAAIPVGSYSEVHLDETKPVKGEGAVNLTAPNPVVFGISSDRKVIYTLGFVEDVVRDEIKPVISTLHPDAGESGHAYCFRSNIRGILIGNENQVNESQQAEMRAILEKVEAIVLTTDNKRAEEASEKERIIELLPLITPDEMDQMLTKLLEPRPEGEAATVTAPEHLSPRETALEGLKEITRIDPDAIEQVTTYDDFVNIFGTLGLFAHILLVELHNDGNPLTQANVISHESEGHPKALLGSTEYTYNGSISEGSSRALQITSVGGFIDFAGYTQSGNPPQVDSVEYTYENLPVRRAHAADFRHLSANPAEVRAKARMMYQFAKDFQVVIEGPEKT